VLGDFKKFLLRGNVVDLAVAVVVGTAFTAVVTALVADLLTPLIGAIFGKHDFSNLAFTLHGSRFAYGHFLNALIAFVSIATVVFFFVVTPVNAFLERQRRDEPPDESLKKCAECLSQIPAAARRCAYCASSQAA
jgi:large conductance mechanosensitive channel